MEMRGHDNDVEVVVFAPLAAYTAIRELAGIPVCLSPASSARAQRHPEYGRKQTRGLVRRKWGKRQDDQDLGHSEWPDAQKSGQSLPTLSADL